MNRNTVWIAGIVAAAGVAVYMLTIYEANKAAEGVATPFKTVYNDAKSAVQSVGSALGF